MQGGDGGKDVLDEMREIVIKHPLMSVLVTAVVVFLFMLLIAIMTGMSKAEDFSFPWFHKKSEENLKPQFQVPWGQKYAENEYMLGSMTPQEIKMYDKLASRSEDMSGLHNSEFMFGKAENSILTKKLYG